MDDTDRRILRQLQERPDMSIMDLAAAVGLSHTPCWRRVKRLKSEGVIQGYRLLLDEKKLGFAINVMASIRLEKHDEETFAAFEEQICAHPQIMDCCMLSGESDFLVRVAAKDMEDYELLLKGTLHRLPGVASVSSNFAIKFVKAHADYPV